jgi:hypothetical protein
MPRLTRRSSREFPESPPTAPEPGEIRATIHSNINRQRVSHWSRHAFACTTILSAGMWEVRLRILVRLRRIERGKRPSVAGYNDCQHKRMEASVTDVAASYGTSKEAAWSWLQIGVTGLASAAMIAYSLWPDSGTTMAMYQRETAPRDACKAAALAIPAFRAMSGLTFAGDCDAPTVTEVLNEPGHFIVTLDMEERRDGFRDRRRTYSVMIDGRGFDKWRILDVKLAPNTLTLDASQLTADLSASLSTQDASSSAN